MFSDPLLAPKMGHINIMCRFPGCGFGGRDNSMFSQLLAMAGFFAQGHPFRMLNSRAEQFQSGIKRHNSRTRVQLAVSDDLKFQAFTFDIEMDGGGQKNYSFAVPADAAVNSASGYTIPRIDAAFRSFASTNVPAGSMRGFGSVQAQFAVESLIDETAHALGQDPLELRLNNALRPGMAVITGSVPLTTTRFADVVQALRMLPLWAARCKFKQEQATPQTLYGVGAAVCMQSFGSNQDSVLAAVSVDTDGRIVLQTNAIDMGNGAATTLTLTTALSLGFNADDIRMGETARSTCCSSNRIDARRAEPSVA